MRNNRFQDFMAGRYGNDELNRFLVIVALICIVVNLFLRTNILWIIAVVLLVLIYFRTFSRNTTQRAIENDRYLDITSRFRRGGRSGRRGYGGQDSYGAYDGYGASGGYSRQEKAERKRAQRQDKRYYKYYNCPNCNQKVRVPKGKGKIEITCPKCRTSFIRRT